MRRFATAPVLLALIAGCSEQPAADPDTPHGEWTALEDLQFNALMNIGQNASEGRWQAVRAEVAKDSFQQEIEKFTSTPLPESLKEHQALKEDIDDNLRRLVGAAKSGGSAEEMKSAWEGTQSAIAARKEKQYGR